MNTDIPLVDPTVIERALEAETGHFPRKREDFVRNFLNGSAEAFARVRKALAEEEEVWEAVPPALYVRGWARAIGAVRLRAEAQAFVDVCDADEPQRDAVTAALGRLAVTYTATRELLLSTLDDGDARARVGTDFRGGAGVGEGDGHAPAGGVRRRRRSGS
ncbi:hypothetical protein ABZX40_41105 [Streptomyces sp. NPDC004610]|uniref:hypothetical protein n=1 Tax=unclassified Streptomyces TaxID=2593676 RepID=UPI0033A0E065